MLTARLNLVNFQSPNICCTQTSGVLTCCECVLTHPGTGVYTYIGQAMAIICMLHSNTAFRHAGKPAQHALL